MLLFKCNRKSRRGANTVQVAVVLAVIGLAIGASVSSIGSNASVEMRDTATRVGDTSSLPDRFSEDYAPHGGSSDSGGGDEGSEGSSGGDSGGGDACP